MKQLIKFIITFAVAAVVLLLFRAMVVTLYTVNDTALQPEFMLGDRILVNRWSYGLRTGNDDGLFRYGRIMKSNVDKGDIIAVDSANDSISAIIICKCVALPGDTITHKGMTTVVPGLHNCADQDYYMVELFDKNKATKHGIVGEKSIIGRVCMVVFNHDDNAPFYTGYDKDRVFVMK